MSWTTHVRCDCVPDIGPAHCHECSTAIGREVEWSECEYFCTCYPVENPWTYYGIVEPGGAFIGNPDCPTHGDLEES